MHGRSRLHHRYPVQAGTSREKRSKAGTSREKGKARVITQIAGEEREGLQGADWDEADAEAPDGFFDLLGAKAVGHSLAVHSNIVVPYVIHGLHLAVIVGRMVYEVISLAALH